MLLRRFLRNHDLIPLFEKALALLDSGWGVGVVGDGGLLASKGLDPAHLDNPGAVRFSASFSNNGHPVGRVVVAKGDGAASVFPARNAQQVADLVAQGLEMLLKQDDARRSLASDTLQKYRELSLLHRATVSLNTSLRLRDVSRALLTECRSGALPMEMGMIFLYDAGPDAPAPAAWFGPARECRLERILTGTLFADLMRANKGEIIGELNSDSRWHGEVPGIRSLLIAPIMAADSRVGALVLATAKDVPIEANHLQYVTTLASVAGTAMGNARHFEGIQSLLKALLQALSTAIDARDPFTAGHSQRVARLGVALAKIVHQDREYFPDLTFTEHKLTKVYYAGLLHDVGKIGVREEVLTKASRLSEQHMRLISLRMALLSEITGIAWSDEFERLSRINSSDTLSHDDASLVVALAERTITTGGRSMTVLSDQEAQALLVPRGNLLPEERREIERHPVESFRILQHIPFPETMRDLPGIIGQHHERLDGSGYPAGLKGDEISLLARLLMIVDVYDAVTMERHYKPALPREKAILVIEDEAARGKLDRRLVRLMSRHIDEIEKDSLRMAMEQDFDPFGSQAG